MSKIEAAKPQQTHPKGLSAPPLLAFAVEARLTNGAIGHGVVFARTDEDARRTAQTDNQCQALLRSKRLPSHDMFRTTFKPGKVYVPQVFQANTKGDSQSPDKNL